jgi:hypothetical protein
MEALYGGVKSCGVSSPKSHRGVFLQKHGHLPICSTFGYGHFFCGRVSSVKRYGMKNPLKRRKSDQWVNSADGSFIWRG